MDHVTFWVLVLLLNNVFNVASNGHDCDVVINELNSDDIGRGEFAEFIELAAVCPGVPTPSLRNYLVIIVKEYEERFKGPAIVFSADLYLQSFKQRKKFFVIGSPNKDMKSVVDMPFTDASVMYYRKAQIHGQATLSSFFTKQSAPVATTDVITNGNKSPMAVILLRDENQNREAMDSILKLRLAYHDQRLHRRKSVPHLKIDNVLEKIIRDHLHEMLLQIRFRAAMLFIMDVLNLLKQESLRMQEKVQTLIGIERYRERLVNSLRTLTTEDGPYIRTFLHNYKCYKDLGRLETCKTMDLDDKDFVLNEQFTLSANVAGTRGTRSELPKLSEFRGKLIDTLIKQLDEYFPEGSLAMFEVFYPENLPDKSEDVYVYAGKVSEVAEKFQINAVEASNEFSFVRLTLIEDYNNDFCTYKEDNDPIQFWSHFMDSATIPWGENIRKLLELVLALPVATAEVERGFSILAHIRYDRRTRLSTEHLQNMMFLRINGPYIDDFDALRYAKAWVASGGRRTDDHRYQQTPTTSDMKALPKSPIF